MKNAKLQSEVAGVLAAANIPPVLPCVVTHMGNEPGKAGYRLSGSWGGVVVTFSVWGEGGRHVAGWRQTALAALTDKFGSARVRQKGDSIIVKK